MTTTKEQLFKPSETQAQNLQEPTDPAALKDPMPIYGPSLPDSLSLQVGVLVLKLAG